MAVVVSIVRGHDASYPFKTIGAADGATLTGERAAGYYLSAVEKGGEPAGTWVGNGAADLGFGDGTRCGAKTSSRCTASPSRRVALCHWPLRPSS